MKKSIKTVLLLLLVHITFGQIFETDKLLVKFKEGSCPNIISTNNYFIFYTEYIEV